MRDAPVDQRRLDSATTAFAQEVGPDLRFDHHEELRLHDVERAADRERPVERQIEHRIRVRHVSTRHILPRQRRRREEHAQFGIAGAQAGDDRTRREHLANRYRVNPDGFFGVEVERHRQIAEALTEATDILVVAKSLIQQVGREHDEREQRRDAVKEVHAKS